MDHAPALHERRIQSTLAHVYRVTSMSEPVTTSTPLDALLRAEEAEPEAHAIREEAFDGLMNYLFSDGPHPGCVVRRAYALAKSIRPELIAHMSLEDLGQMLGETRAAQSWRIKKIFSNYLASAGCRATHARFQKSATACDKYSAVQRGNHNRRNGRKQKAVNGSGNGTTNGATICAVA